ncbi:MAG: PDZ domain-containing protein [Candidatus Syntrophonatronum acetioxidans]|uniref:PDZ domain-containing protein n=1 Tax=Candidatus Syntrophonatronum acetioxidans TaxID=1795816 RepID=A0A424YFR8_9FIRM|nr:MAG: PDZ domain-containing protein [Candidatus Syntrophonatronum acetioxidans]
MDHFNDFEQKPRGGGFFSYIIMALVGAIIGGLMVSFFLPYVLEMREARPPADIQPPPVNGEVTPPVEDYHEFQNTAVVKAAEQVTPAVVGITNMVTVYDFYQGQQRLQERASGSGVIINSQGYIATNYHVIAEAEELVVTLGTGEEISAQVVGQDPGTDLAVLKIDKEDLPAARFGDSDHLQVGELAIAIGNPLGLEFQQSVTVGVISALERSIRIGEQDFSFVQTDAAINQGNSGGPLINAIGEVIGINTAKINIPGVEGMGFAIPSNEVEKIIQELIERGRIIRPWIGVMIMEIDQDMAQRFDLPVTEGLLVEEVVDGGPAERAGLQPGDIILQLAGEEIDTFDRLKEVIDKHEIGEQVSLVVLRQEEEISFEVTFEEMPEQAAN